VDPWLRHKAVRVQQQLRDGRGGSPLRPIAPATRVDVMTADRAPQTSNSTRYTSDSANPIDRLVRLASPSLLGRQLTVEFIGTFVLVLTIGLATSTKGAGALAPVAIGSALMVMVFAGGHISGAHYNPAVSLAMLLAGKLRPRNAAPYVITQLAAGALAALLVRGFVGPATPSALGADWKILVGEFIFTLALAYVVLNVTAVPATEGNSFYGLAIGFTVATGVFTVGRITGGVFNLAAALAGSITGALTWSHSWIYLLASVLGGAFAAVLYAYLNPLPTE
jgi:aquaporin Z